MLTSRSVQLAALMGLVLHAANAATWSRIIEANPEFPGMCVDPDTGIPHTPGVEWSNSKFCGSNICHQEKEGHFVLNEAGCGSTFFLPGCPIVEDKEAVYPDCCPEPNCKLISPISVNKKKTKKWLITV